MRDFVKMMRQYASPYKGYLAGAVGLNILSAVFNIFSFAVLIPLLNILFKVDSAVYEFMPWGTEGASFKDGMKSIHAGALCRGKNIYRPSHPERLDPQRRPAGARRRHLRLQQRDRQGRGLLAAVATTGQHQQGADQENKTEKISYQIRSINRMAPPLSD